MGISMLKVSPIPMIPSCEISSENFVTSYLKEDGKGNQLLVSYDFICTPFVPLTHNYLILNTSYFLRGEVTIVSNFKDLYLMLIINTLENLNMYNYSCNKM